MYQRILVPVDGSDTSNLALASAIGLAKEFNGRIRVVHVLDETTWLAGYDTFGGSSGTIFEAMINWGDQVLRQAMEKARAAGVEADMMLHDKPGLRLGEAVAQAARLWNADLLVIGTHGRKGFARVLLGSGAEQVIRHAPVPILVIRAPSASEIIAPKEPA